MQQFINAERTNDSFLHVSTTKLILNILAVTGHSNYTKTSRLYLQSVAILEKENPQVLEQFIIGNYTVRCREKICSRISTDLRNEPILITSLKGRVGVIGKGMTEKALSVWKKTIHRCTKVNVIALFSIVISIYSQVFFFLSSGYISGLLV